MIIKASKIDLGTEVIIASKSLIFLTLHVTTSAKFYSSDEANKNNTRMAREISNLKKHLEEFRQETDKFRVCRDDLELCKVIYIKSILKINCQTDYQLKKTQHLFFIPGSLSVFIPYLGSLTLIVHRWLFS